jgi:VCBS repeat-containing protein
VSSVLASEQNGKDFMAILSARNGFIGPQPRRHHRPAVAADVRLLEARTLLSGNPPTVADATFAINENLVSGSVVGTVVASDPDASETLSYAITAGNTGGAFAINSTTGVITVDNAAAVDFETNPTFALTVEVTDSEVPMLSDTATITINLNNVNDPPTVVLGSSVVSIDENSSTSIPLIVTSVTVNDDALGNETLSLSGPDAALFHIAGATLRVNAGTVLDFETKSTYEVTVNVNDPTVGDDIDDSQTFTLNLNNVAEPPTITAGQLFKAIPNSPNGTVVGQVAASDPDGGPLLYAIIGGNAGGAFQINRNTGVLTVANSAAVTPGYISVIVRVKDNNDLALNEYIHVLANNTPTISGGLANQPVLDTETIAPFASLVVTDADAQKTTVRVEIPHLSRGDFTPASVAGWTRSTTSNRIRYIRTFYAAPATGPVIEAALRDFVFQPTPDSINAGKSETLAFSLTIYDGLESANDNNISIRITNENQPPVMSGTVANQPVNDDATIAPFSQLTINDPDNQSMTATVRISNGVVRGDFTAASAAGWMKTTIGNNFQYTRTFLATADIGSTVQAAMRALVFQPRSNALKPNTTETTGFTVTISDGYASPLVDSTTSVITTSVNDTPVFGGLNANVAVNDNATVNPFTSLTVTDPDNQEMLISVTILNGKFRGDFTNATSSGWTVRQVSGNNITYKRYFSPGANVGATVEAAFRALTFQPRTNAIKPGTTEAVDFQVTVSDGVTPAVVGTGTRVTITSVNEAPVIGGAAANQVMNDDSTKAVFSSLTVIDPNTQDLFARITITNGTMRGDFTAASTAGWTRKLGSGGNIVYERFFGAAANNGANVQAAIRALIFQPRSNVPVGTTETTSFTVFVNDGLANVTDGTTSVSTTGGAP